MSRSERESFLAYIRVGVLSVADPRGRLAPLVVPVWYSYQPGGDLFVQTARDSLKARFLRKAGRFSLCVQVETAPYRYVSVEGPILGVDDLLNPADRELLAFRYLPPDTAKSYLMANESQIDTDVVFRMKSERWRTADFSAFSQKFSWPADRSFVEANRVRMTLVNSATDSGSSVPTCRVTDYPRDRRLHSLFDERACSDPDGVAAVQGTASLSYAQLQAQSYVLAARLRAAHAQPGDQVGVCGSRSLEALVAFLGILRVGAAYVPLDDDQPSVRLNAMAEDIGVRVVVSLPGSICRIHHIATTLQIALDPGCGGNGVPRMPCDGVADGGCRPVTVCM